MNKQLLLLLLIGYSAIAQITSIPDPAFEQELISQNIDSDGTVNGQVLTSDVENITELIIEINNNLSDMTGLEAFTNLQNLTIMYTGLTQLDISNNIQLTKLICQSNMLSDIDVSANTLLEEINVGNELDLGPFNMITELDLSNNPNIRSVNTLNLQCDFINLKNGNNNSEMNLLFGYTPWASDPNDVLITICLQVDDKDLAQSNQPPYSTWNINHPHAAYIFSEDCALGTQSFSANNSISIYPNPTSDMLYFSTANGAAVDKATLYDISGRIVKEFGNISNSEISVAGLAKGVYVIQMFSGSAVQTDKIVVE